MIPGLPTTSPMTKQNPRIFSNPPCQRLIEEALPGTFCIDFRSSNSSSQKQPALIGNHHLRSPPTGPRWKMGPRTWNTKSLWRNWFFLCGGVLGKFGGIFPGYICGQNHATSWFLAEILFPTVAGHSQTIIKCDECSCTILFWLWLSPRIPFDPPPKQNVSHHQAYDILSRESLQTFICHDCILGGGFSSKIPAGAIKSGDPSKVVGGNYRQLLVWSSQSVSSQNLGLLNTSIHGLDHRWRWPYLLTQLG